MVAPPTPSMCQINVFFLNNPYEKNLSQRRKQNLFFLHDLYKHNHWNPRHKGGHVSLNLRSEVPLVRCSYEHNQKRRRISLYVVSWDCNRCVCRGRLFKKSTIGIRGYLSRNFYCRGPKSRDGKKVIGDAILLLFSVLNGRGRTLLFVSKFISASLGNSVKSKRLLFNSASFKCLKFSKKLKIEGRVLGCSRLFHEENLEEAKRPNEVHRQKEQRQWKTQYRLTTSMCLPCSTSAYLVV